jgi:hypothetical protein
MAKLFLRLSDGEFEALADIAADSAPMRKSRKVGHAFDECVTPHRCNAHRRQAAAAKRHRAFELPFVMAEIANAPIPGTAAYAADTANARG